MPDGVAEQTLWPPRRVAAATLVVAAVVAGVALLYLFGDVLFLLLIGIVVAIALNPMVEMVQRCGLSRAAASIVVYLVLVGALVAATWIALPSVFWQTEALLDRLPHTYRQLREYLQKVPSEVVSQFAQRLPRRLSAPAAAATGPEEAMNAVSQVLGYAALMTRGIYVVMAMMLLAFYWSVYEERTIRSFLLIVPPARRDRARELVAQVIAKLGAYVRAQGLLCLIMGGLVLIAYWLIGVPYALSLAVVAGVLEALPVFGPVLAAIPALLVALSVSASTALWVLGAVIIIQQFESNVLVPKLMDRSVGVNAIVTLLAIAALSALWGLAGAVLAIPMAAVVQLALDLWVFRPEALEMPEPTGRDAASLLRYQLRELLRDVQVEFRRKETQVTVRSDRLEEAVESLARDLDRALDAIASSPATAASPVEVGS